VCVPVSVSMTHAHIMMKIKSDCSYYTMIIARSRSMLW